MVHKRCNSCEVTSGVTLFKLLDINRSNSKKKTLINANILIRVSLIIAHLLYFIFISKPKKNVIFDSLSLYVSLSISFSSTVFLMIKGVWMWIPLKDFGCRSMGFICNLETESQQHKIWIWKRLKLEIQPKEGKLSYFIQNPDNIIIFCNIWNDILTFRSYSN